MDEAWSAHAAISARIEWQKQAPKSVPRKVHRLEPRLGGEGPNLQEVHGLLTMRVFTVPDARSCGGHVDITALEHL